MSEFIAEAQVLILPNIAQFATSLRKQVEAAVAAAGPIAIPVVAASGKGVAAAAAAEGELAVNTKAASRAAEEQAGVLSAQRAAAKAAALAAKELAAEQAIAARRTAQVSRAVEAQAASLVGVRGAVLTASTPFLLATAAVIAFSKSIKEASSETEELNKTAVVFGSSAEQIEEFSKTTAKSLGISSVEALKAAGIFGNLFRSIDIGQRPAAQMSERLVRLASDLASFNNADPSRVLEALRSGLVGQARPLRVFGIFLTQARAQEEALIETGKKNIKALTNEEIVRARFNLILKDSVLAQGDFGRTSDRLANQTRTLTANLSDLGAQAGQVLIPAVTAAVGAANDLFGAIQTANTAVVDLEHDLKKLADVGPIKIPVEIIRKGLGAGDQGPGGPPSLEESLKKAVVPAALIAASIGVIAAPETGGLSLVAAQAALVAGGLIGAKQATDAYSKATRQAIVQAQRFAGSLRGVGVDTKAAETPLLSVVTDAQKLVQSLSVQAFPADGLKALLPHLTAVISVLQTGPPLAQAFADKLQGIELKLQLAAASNLSPDELRKVLADVQKELETFFKGHPLNVTADVVVKTRVSLDTETAAAAFAGPAAELAQAQVNRAEGLQNLRALLGLSPDASRADIQLAIDAGKFSKGRQTAINRALDEVTAADRVISAAATTAVNNKKAAAADAKQAAQDAARAQEVQTQAFIDLFAPKKQRLQNRISTAELFGTAKTQIALNKLIIAADKAEITAIRDRISHLKLHGAALKLAKATIQALNQEIFNTRNAILELQASRKQAIADARQSHLEAQLAIAETTTSTKDDRAAEKALIAFDQAQIKRLAALKKRGKATRDEIAQLDAYRVDLAQRKKALKDLQNQNEDTSKQQKSLFFTFLQTQSGFAANLLGNLIPGFATAGLVGNASVAPSSSGDGLRQVPGGFEQPRGSVASAAAVAGSRERGVRPVQVDTTNHLLRQILAAVQGRRVPPETRFQRHESAAAFDGVHGN